MILRLTSGLIFMTIISITFLSIFFYPSFYQELAVKQQNDYNISDFTLGSLIKGIGIIFLLFENILSIFTYVKFEGNPKISQLKKIFKRTYLVICYFYMIQGLSAYLSIGFAKADSYDMFFDKIFNESPVPYLKFGYVFGILALVGEIYKYIYSIKLVF